MITTETAYTLTEFYYKTTVTGVASLSYFSGTPSELTQVNANFNTTVTVSDATLTECPFSIKPTSSFDDAYIQCLAPNSSTSASTQSTHRANAGTTVAPCLSAKSMFLLIAVIFSSLFA